MNNINGNHKEDRSGLLISGSILTGLGVLFLLITLEVIPGWRHIWPAIIIVIGLSLIIGAFSKRKKEGNI
jgi:LiaI-LiaF-like transmembrane region